MALTMTRTRTQTTLTKLAELVANVNGELAFIGEYLPKDIADQAFLQSRRKLLLGQRDALFATLKQFDPGLRPEDIGTSDDWLKAFGRRGRSKAGVRRYLSALKSPLPLVK